MEIFEIIKALCPKAGVSGAESEAAKAAAKLLSAYGEVSITPNSNVICKVGTHSEDRPSLLIDAHIDEIGMIVTHITEDGFVKVSGCGGVDVRVLPASVVKILGRQEVTGVVTSVAPHLSDDRDAVPEMDKVLIDTGFTKAELEKLVKIGDRVLIENEPVLMQNGLVSAKALDDRSGCAAVIRALELIKDKDLKKNVTVMFSSTEEIGCRGAKTGAYTGDYDEAIAVDVTFGLCHGENKAERYELSKGSAIGVSSSLSQEMSDALIDTAKQNGIPYQIEVMGELTGTNADSLAVSKGGIKAVTLSIPERYMHTPVEVVSLEDCENTAKLLAAYILARRV